MRLADRATTLTAWHGDYYYLRAALDTRDPASAATEESLYAATERAEEPLRAALVKLDGATLERFLAQEPRLRPWRDHLAEQRRLGARPLAPGAAELGTLATAWQFPLYQRLVERTAFGTVPGPDGPLDVRRQRIAIAASPDSALREEGARKLAEGYARSRDLFAFTLLRTVEAQNALARARGYADRPAQAYDSRQLSVAGVRALVAAVRERGAIFQRYEATLARSQRALRGTRPPRLTQEQVAGAMRAALRRSARSTRGSWTRCSTRRTAGSSWGPASTARRAASRSCCPAALTASTSTASRATPRTSAGWSTRAGTRSTTGRTSARARPRRTAPRSPRRPRGSTSCSCPSTWRARPRTR